MKKGKKPASKLSIEEKQKLIRRDHLKRELKYKELNWKILKEKWFDLMSFINLPDIREEFKNAWMNFERVVDHKDYTLSCMLDELDEAEEQRLRNMDSHMYHVDKLIEFVHNNVKELDSNYRADLTKLKESAAELENELIDNQQREEDYLNSMLYAIEMKQLESEKMFKADCIIKLDDERTKYAEMRQSLRAILEGQLNGLWEQCMNVITKYETETADRRKVYEELKERNIQVSATIQHQLQVTQNQFASMRILREQLQADTLQHQAILRDIEDERSTFADKYGTLREQLCVERKIDQEQMMILTRETHSILKWLEPLVKKGESVLRMASICRKLETQEEKIIPFLKQSKDIEDLSAKDFTDGNLEKIFQGIGPMNKFWIRVGNADLKRADLVLQVDGLRLENFYLKEALKRYIHILEQADLEATFSPKSKN